MKLTVFYLYVYLLNETRKKELLREENKNKPAPVQNIGVKIVKADDCEPVITRTSHGIYGVIKHEMTHMLTYKKAITGAASVDDAWESIKEWIFVNQ